MGDVMSSGTRISVFRRLALVPGKIRAQGFVWFGRRLCEIAASFMRGDTLRAEIQKIRVSVLRIVTLRVREFRRNNTDVLHVFYDLDLYPISYDVGYFIIWADLERRRRELAQLHMVFVPVHDEEVRKFPAGYSEIVDQQSRQWRFRNIVMPITALLRSSQGITVCSSRAQADAIILSTKNHFPERQLLAQRQPGLSAMYRDIVSTLTLGSDYAGLQSTTQGLRYIDNWISQYAHGRRLIVITLRQYRVDPQRNNDLDAWISFARELDSTIYAPVFVPDTDHAYDDSRARLTDFLILDAAAWSLEIRMALYQRAYLNMTVNTGPATLCVLSSACRYLMFKITVPDVHLASERVLLEYGFQPGQDPPFTTPFQKWVWEPDQLPVIRREFDAMCRVIEAGTPSEGVARQPTS
jgi:hypothetical protein